jgi:putative membrane protein insertion efficiency factor
MLSLRRILLWIIRGYQLTLSPWLGGQCRFHPSCSCYAHTAIERFGAWRGGWLSLRRLLRCHPFVAGGYDPVPDERAPVPDPRAVSAARLIDG